MSKEQDFHQDSLHRFFRIVGLFTQGYVAWRATQEENKACDEFTKYERGQKNHFELALDRYEGWKAMKDWKPQPRGYQPPHFRLKPEVKPDEEFDENI